MTRELRTPFGEASQVVELSRGRYRKQVLRFGAINYRDRSSGQTRQIVFNKQYGNDLVRSFHQGAYDQVPFQLADPTNAHNNDPTRTGGELVGVELSRDGSGVDGIFNLWGAGLKVVDLNKKLGVSARIIENLQQPDGRRFPRAIQHVLGTVDPQIAQMSPWEQVELSSSDVNQSLDLSGAEYERSSGMSEKVTLELSTAQAERLQTILDDDEALDALRSAMGLRDDEDNTEDEDVEDIESDDEDEDELLSDQDIANLLSDDDDEEDEEETELSNLQYENLQSALSSQESRIVELTNALNDQRTDYDIQNYLDRGLAPAVLSAARSLLEVPTGAVELSNGSGTRLDPGEAVRELLDAVVELASTGHLLTDPDQEEGALTGNDSQASARDALVKDWAENYG